MYENKASTCSMEKQSVLYRAITFAFMGILFSLCNLKVMRDYTSFTLQKGLYYNYKGNQGEQCRTATPCTRHKLKLDTRRQTEKAKKKKEKKRKERKRKKKNQQRLIGKVQNHAKIEQIGQKSHIHKSGPFRTIKCICRLKLLSICRD